jgi:dCTP deaminase
MAMDDATPPTSARAPFGVLSCEQIAELTARGAIRAERPIEDGQRQPASLDLRLGATAFRVRASFLPGTGRSVEALLDELAYDEIALDGRGAVLERGCVYVIPLQESLALPADVAAVANPKSSTGRLDIFTRLITDGSEIFDHVAAGYHGRLYAEVSPRSFSVRVRAGSRLDQMRFRRRDPARADLVLSDAALAAEHARAPLVDGDLTLRDGVILRVALDGFAGGVIGYRAQKHADVIDVDLIDHYAVEDYWEKLAVRAHRKLILDPDEFYILASRERLGIPAHLSAEMMAIDPAMGEFRVHYAGFFDPGFGCCAPDGRPASRAVLEVRSHDVPFILEDGQVIGRLVYEPMAAEPKILYGEAGASNYQGQELKLSKHFKAP